MRSYSTAYGKTQLVMTKDSNGKRPCATKSLERLCTAGATCAVLSCGNHPTQCCLAQENILPKTCKENVKIGGLQKYVHSKVVQHILFFSPESSRENIFAALLLTPYPQTLFLEWMRCKRTHRGLARRSHSLKYRSVGRGTKLRLQTSGQNWQVRSSAWYGPHHAPLYTHEYIWHLWVPRMLIDNIPEKVVDISRVPDAVLGLPTVGPFVFVFAVL